MSDITRIDELQQEKNEIQLQIIKLEKQMKNDHVDSILKGSMFILLIILLILLFKRKTADKKKNMQIFSSLDTSSTVNSEQGSYHTVISQPDERRTNMSQTKKKESDNENQDLNQQFGTNQEKSPNTKNESQEKGPNTKNEINKIMGEIGPSMSSLTDSFTYDGQSINSFKSFRTRNKQQKQPSNTASFVSFGTPNRQQKQSSARTNQRKNSSGNTSTSSSSTSSSTISRRKKLDKQFDKKEKSSSSFSMGLG